MGGSRIAILLDNPKRDGRGVALLAYELQKRGACAYVVPMYQQGIDLPLIAPDWVVVNYARLNNKPLLEAYRALGARVAVMDTEGGILSESGLDSPDNWARTFRGSGLSSCVDHYFFWGERVRDAFAQHSGIPLDRLTVTGCPRYDLCAPKWRGMMDYKREGYVLVNTNFSAINPAFTDSDASEMAIFEQLGWGADYVQALFGELRAVFPRYLDAIAELADSQPDRCFLVRPHPFEDARLYEKRFKGLDNVVVDGEGDVLNVIAHADCVLHLNCGSAVETVLLGKIPISMEFLNTGTMRRHASLPSQLSCLATSMEDLSLLIRDAALRTARFDADSARARIEPWFHSIDGCASARVAEILAAAKSTRAQSKRSLTASLRGGWPQPSLGQLMQGLASQIFGSLGVAWLRSLARPGRRDKSLASNQLLGMLQGLVACEGNPMKLRVRHACHPHTGLPLASLHLECA